MSFVYDESSGRDGGLHVAYGVSRGGGGGTRSVVGGAREPPLAQPNYYASGGY